MKYVTTLLLCIINLMLVNAQNDSVMISGMVYDYETRETLKKASFKLNGEFVDISEDGKFQVYVKANDSLSFKYSGYKDYTILVPSNLDQISYISGIFLNKAEIEDSKAIILPREYKVESLATYDPLERQQMLQNANRNLAVASYQASQAREMDAYDNTKLVMTQKETEIEYKGLIAPNQMVGISTSTSITHPKEDLKLDKFGNKAFRSILPVTPKEEFYIKTIFESNLESAIIPEVVK